jgi:hypothetical protein
MTDHNFDAAIVYQIIAERDEMERQIVVKEELDEKIMCLVGWLELWIKGRLVPPIEVVETVREANLYLEDVKRKREE